MTDFNHKTNDSKLKKYLIIYKFNNIETDFEFTAIIKEHFKNYYDHGVYKEETNIYVKTSLEREDFISALKFLVSQIKIETCKSDFVYIIHKLTKDYRETDKERDIIIGHENVLERDKAWVELSAMFKYIHFKADE